MCNYEFKIELNKEYQLVIIQAKSLKEAHLQVQNDYPGSKIRNYKKI